MLIREAHCVFFLRFGVFEPDMPLHRSIVSRADFEYSITEQAALIVLVVDSRVVRMVIRREHAVFDERSDTDRSKLNRVDTHTMRRYAQRLRQRARTREDDSETRAPLNLEQPPGTRGLRRDGTLKGLANAVARREFV